MKAPLSILLFALTLTGCATKATARREAEKAFIEAQQREQAEQERLHPSVWFRGDVRKQRVPWTEGLTLAQALVAAQYTFNSDPHTITVTRQGELHPVNARRLLRGQEDPLLEPGDVVEVRH